MSAPGTPKEAGNCTCGKCLDGWLSPRMKERLEAEAEFLHFTSSDLAIDLDINADLLEDGVLSEHFIGADVSLHYIPMELHSKMTPTFYHGYILILEAILQIILKDPESEADNHTVIPTVTAVTQRLESIKESARHPDPTTSEESKANTATQSQCIQAYLSSGGKVEFALDALTDSVYEKSPEGSWYSRRQYLKEEEAEFEKEVADLPRCENDLDIGLVRVKLGISRERKGPQWFFLTDSESDEDDEDDDENGETVYEGTRSDETEQ